MVRLMLLVNPQKIRVPKGHEGNIYIVNDIESVKLYGILIKFLKDKSD